MSSPIIHNSLTTKQVIVRITLIVSLVEFLVMLAIHVLSKDINAYLEATIDIVLLVTLSTPLILIMVVKPFVNARDEAHERLNHLAQSDPLTELPNRRCINMHLEKYIAGSQRNGVQGAVLMMDLDGFKHINDIHGHEAGDAVLVEVANRLRSRARSADVVGRLGGDEFIMLIQNLNPNEHIACDTVRKIAEQLVDLLSTPIDYNGTKLHVGASIGVRLFGLDELQTDAVIKDADVAMYRAKAAGKGRCEIFRT